MNGETGSAPAALSPPKPMRLVPATVDEPLTQLIDERNRAQLNLERAQQNMDEFLIAVEIISSRACGRELHIVAFPEGVNRWLEKLGQRTPRGAAPSDAGARAPQAGETQFSRGPQREEPKRCPVPGCGVVINKDSSFCRMHMR